MRIGIFGGSFDPVHNGHLLAAECCREQAKLDQVLGVEVDEQAAQDLARTSPSMMSP